MWSSNPTWGAPRIQAELHKLGIDVSDSTIRRYRPARPGQPSQNWRSFLENHLGDIVAMDFFTVPTATFRVPYVLVIMAHDRRRILHFNVTTSSQRSLDSTTSRRRVPLRHQASIPAP
jgi:putative transposase